MADTLKPRDAKEVEEAVGWALAGGKALEIVGRGTKRAIGRAAQGDATLDLSGFSGITLYAPGGHVPQNVPASGLCKLAAGSPRSLPAMTDVTITTLPRAETEETVLVLN